MKEKETRTKNRKGKNDPPSEVEAMTGKKTFSCRNKRRTRCQCTKRKYQGPFLHEERPLQMSIASSPSIIGTVCLLSKCHTGTLCMVGPWDRLSLPHRARGKIPEASPPSSKMRRVDGSKNKYDHEWISYLLLHGALLRRQDWCLQTETKEEWITVMK